MENVSSGPLEFRVAGDGAELVVSVKAYQHPTCDDYWDGNWLLADLRIRLLGFRAAFEMSVRSPELKAFLSELERMNQTLTGSARYEMMEPSLTLNGIIGKRGTIEWTGVAQHPLGSSNELSFEFESDQSYLDNLIDSLKVVLHRFPIKGKAK